MSEWADEAAMGWLRRGGSRALDGHSVPGPQAPKAWQFLRWISDPIGFAEACQRRHGPVFAIRVYLFDRVVFATDPADVKTILTDSDHFVGGVVARRLVEPAVGSTSVLTTTGAAHMRQRKLLLPPMHEDLVERWFERIESIAEAELSRLPLDRPVPLRPALQRVTLDVMCRLVFGAEGSDQLGELRRTLVRSLDPRLAPLLFFPTMLRRRGRLNPATKALDRREQLHRLIAGLIAERRRDPGLEARDDVLSLLICARDEEGGAFTDVELRDQLMTLLIAGHETTATGLTWAIERLSRTPRARDRLAASILEGEDDYLDAAVKETLRIRPPIVNVPRTTTEPVELGGHRIAPGTSVAAMLSLTHRRPDLWPAPLAFRPERFLEGKPLPYSFVPFGGGIRRCIGASLAMLEMRVVLRAAMRRFRLEAPEEPEERIRLYGPVLAPSRGGRVILRPV
jgi:cytochrome P450 family 135